jgi:signal transduction histidine kinase
MPLGLLSIDNQGVIESISSSAANILQYQPEQLKGRSISYVLDGCHFFDGTEITAWLRTEASARAIELNGRKADGGLLPIEIAVCKSQDERSTNLVVAMSHNTSRKKPDLIKRDVLAMLSHDLRTPLNSVLGFLQLLEMGTYGEIHPQGRERLAIAERNIIRLIELSNDLLDIEKLESGVVAMDFSENSIESIIEGACESVRCLAEEKCIKILRPRTQTIARFDRGRIEQVIVNLLENAIKFSPTNAQVEVEVKKLDDSIQIAVCDHGPGIAKEYQQVIFERFRQLQTKSSTPCGNGLGLSIARAIVEQHGGAIGVSSREGAGSTFWFIIPDQNTGELAESTAEPFAKNEQSALSFTP